MNKKANLFLNIGEFVFLLLALLLINIYLKNNELSFIIRNIFFLLAIITGLLFISIECFLFILMKIKVKIAYIFFLILDIALAVYLNLIIPFSSATVFLAFCLLKNSLRILLVNKLYIPREFNYYCRMFGIKVKDFKKKKVVKKVTKKKEVIEIPAEAKETKTKRGRKPAKSMEETA